ncbi:LysR family transcriptional regulator [Sneathiella sp. P13V-1]|uniref:LysR substrate-binding domain-containing protein n=1 Tax=Sneathiella sp. P13V-1 TaxID=2697366 RepID=UPI00187B5F4B|nr:LysR substrate-binding domain-containing protein [Sneathiella sp. P13V-1]MBE7635312.1 LysR family transcriptional regulator [Sneathiella sp. P13V-1]
MFKANLNSLRVFEAAARHGNFRKASEELNLTQGAVAQRVRKLEQDLGVGLFSRHARGLQLTDKGKEYLAAVRTGLTTIDLATTALLETPHKLRISLPPSFATKWFVPRLAEMATEFPDISFQTIASETLADFEKDEIDIAIRIGRKPDVTNLNAVKLSDLNLRAAATPSYIAASKTETLEEISHLNLLQDSHRYWEHVFEEDKIDPTGRVFDFNQTALAIDAAVNGQGVVLAPDLLISNDLAEGRLIEVCDIPHKVSQKYYILWPMNHPNANLVKRFVEWIMEKTK